MGHIDWSIPQVIPCNPETELNIKLLDIIDENNLHQIVNVPTRKERILDLILVTNPSNINKVNTLPPLGLSDHDVYTEADIWLRKVRQQSRKIFKYDKTNWDNIKSDLEDTLNKIININNDTKSTVNEMLNLFKNNLTESIDKNIPHKMLIYKHRLPWVHNKLRKMG